MNNEEFIQVPTPQQANDQRAMAILDAAKHCPFCGSTDLTVNDWILAEEEVYAIECKRCLAGAPAAVWSHRSNIA